MNHECFLPALLSLLLWEINLSRCHGAALRSPRLTALSPAEYEEVEELEVKSGFVPVRLQHTTNLLAVDARETLGSSPPGLPPAPAPVVPPAFAPGVPSSPAPGLPIQTKPMPSVPPAPAPVAYVPFTPFPQSFAPPLGLAPPAPALTFMPAPSPLPVALPAVAPAPGPSANGTASLTLRVEHVSYSDVMANPTLRSDLEQTLKEDIAARAGNGVTADDVYLTFDSGSVVVTATIVPHDASTDATAVQDSLCATGASLSQDLQNDISHLNGINQVTTGSVVVDDVNSCGVTTTASLAYAPAPFPFIAPDASLDTCNPGCVEGQGICSDSLCFCKTPYTGVRCERALSTTQIYRIKYAMATGIVTVALVLGATAGTLFWHMVLAPRLKQIQIHKEEKEDVTKETWVPVPPRQ